MPLHPVDGQLRFGLIHGERKAPAVCAVSMDGHSCFTLHSRTGRGVTRWSLRCRYCSTDLKGEGHDYSCKSTCTLQRDGGWTAADSEVAVNRHCLAMAVLQLAGSGRRYPQYEAFLERTWLKWVERADALDPDRYKVLWEAEESFRSYLNKHAKVEGWVAETKETFRSRMALCVAGMGNDSFQAPSHPERRERRRRGILMRPRGPVNVVDSGEAVDVLAAAVAIAIAPARAVLSPLEESIDRVARGEDVLAAPPANPDPPAQAESVGGDLRMEGSGELAQLGAAIEVASAADMVSAGVSEADVLQLEGPGEPAQLGVSIDVASAMDVDNVEVGEAGVLQ